jgi:hypothetical protein
VLRANGILGWWTGVWQGRQGDWNATALVIMHARRALIRAARPVAAVQAASVIRSLFFVTPVAAAGLATLAAANASAAAASSAPEYRTASSPGEIIDFWFEKDTSQMR